MTKKIAVYERVLLLTFVDLEINIDILLTHIQEPVVMEPDAVDLRIIDPFAARRTRPRRHLDAFVEHLE